MCLAIPGQVVEMVDEVNQIAKVDVVGSAPEHQREPARQRR